MKKKQENTKNILENKNYKSSKTKLSCKFCTGFEDKIKVDNDSLFIQEVAEMRKHDLIACIASYLGSDPEYFNVAEELFEVIKYPLAEYVLKHEFNKNHNLSVHLALWLEEQTSPKAAEPIKNIVDTYLRVAK